MYYSDLDTRIERDMNGRDLYKMALRVLIGADRLERCPGHIRAVAAGPRRMELRDPFNCALRFGRLVADNGERRRT